MLTRLILIGSLPFGCLAQTGTSAANDPDKAWIAAILSRDVAALDRLLDEKLIYAHASGVVDTKSDYIGKIRSGRQVYKTFQQKNVTQWVQGNTLITHSWVSVTGVNAQGPFDDKIMMLHVWLKDGPGWKLAAHQTTRVTKLP